MREANLQRLSSYNVPKSNINYLHYHTYTKALIKAINAYSKGKLLDIGCGNKPYEPLFEGKISEYLGCDVIQSSRNCVDVICEANKIPLDAGSFETIISTQTIEHVADNNGLVSEAARLLKKDGYFILSGPMYWYLHEEPYDFFRFTKYGFRYLLEKNGFKVVEIIPNGGKWALAGQIFMHTFPNWLIKPKVIKLLINKLFSYLDNKYFDDKNTMNYVVVGQKI